VTEDVIWSDDEAGELAEIGVLAGLLSDDGPRGELGDRHLEIVRKRAALVVRRMANQHGCTGTTLDRYGRSDCQHPDHRRDVDYCREMLSCLDLPSVYVPVTQAERVEHVTGVAQDLPHYHNGSHPRTTKNWANGFTSRKGVL
jgi:hypothetical protein